MTDEKSRTIYLLSDGTCRTCEAVVKAVLVQFDETDVRVVRKPNVRRPETVTELVRKAADEHAVVFYTLVYDKARAAIQETARELMVPTVDLLEPVMVALFDLFKHTPRRQPGILYKSNQDYYDRLVAVEFTIHHDDGLRIHELGEADIVLVGVSRASKSTTCFYLAYSGVRAANVPLFADQDVPPELLGIDQRRIIGLTINPYRLRSVREARLRGWGMEVTHSYADHQHIAHELRIVHELMARHGWQCIDVSYKAIEEIAREARQMLEDSGAGLRPRES
jgi:regulator of PEP synthase PpsR (kinase-PPPase family)